MTRPVLSVCCLVWWWWRLVLHQVGMLYMSSMSKADLVAGHGDMPNTAVPRLGVPPFHYMGQGQSVSSPRTTEEEQLSLHEGNSSLLKII